MAEVVAAGLLTSAVVTIAVRKLGSAIEEQSNLAWNFSDHLQDMKDTMESIAAVLKDAEKQSVQTEQGRLWLKRLKNTAQGISDMMDNYQDQSAQQVRKLLQAIGITLIYAVLLRPRIDEHELQIDIPNIVTN
jgi:methyl-accepting chemotaxis protein